MNKISETKFREKINIYLNVSWFEKRSFIKGIKIVNCGMYSVCVRIFLIKLYNKMTVTY